VDIDTTAFAGWLNARRAEIDRGELIYVTHQLDIFGHAPG
jgi:hypothetical protein